MSDDDKFDLDREARRGSIVLEREARRLEREKEAIERAEQELQKALRKALKDPESRRSITVDALERKKQGGIDFRSVMVDDRGTIGFSDFLDEGPITIDKIGNFYGDDE